MPNKSSTSKAASLSPVMLNSIRGLALLRIATGAACLFAPRFTCAQHHYTVDEKDIFSIRMMAIREGVIGGLLITAGDKKSPNEGRREIRRALWAGIIADSVDICTLSFGFAMGQVGGFTAKLIGGAAVGAISLATFILRGLYK